MTHRKSSKKKRSEATLGGRLGSNVLTETPLVGTWMLLSREEVTSDGQRRIDPILGPNSVACLMYDASGHFAVQFMRRDRESAAGAIDGYDAYFGRYSVGSDGTVTQELVGALSPADVGKVVTRRGLIQGTELVIDLETIASDGERVKRTLRWQRVG